MLFLFNIYHQICNVRNSSFCKATKSMPVYMIYRIWKGLIGWALNCSFRYYQYHGIWKLQVPQKYNKKRLQRSSVLAVTKLASQIVISHTLQIQQHLTVTLIVFIFIYLQLNTPQDSLKILHTSTILMMHTVVATQESIYSWRKNFKRNF